MDKVQGPRVADTFFKNVNLSFGVRVATQIRVQKYPQRDPQNQLHDRFYVHCAIKFVQEHENFRRKPLKGNGRGRIREGKEKDPLGYRAGLRYCGALST